MKAIDFAMRLMRACLNNPTSLMENAVLFAIAAGLDHKDDIARELRHNPGAVSTCLHRLAKGDYIASTTWHEDGSPPLPPVHRRQGLPHPLLQLQTTLSHD